MPAPRRPLSRRRLIGLTGATAVGALAVGCSGSDLLVPDGSGTGAPGAYERAYCVARGELASHADIAGLPLVYEVDQQHSSFRIDAGFTDQLASWARSLPAVGVAADQVWTYGTWIDGGDRCDSWHHAGRAFDLSRVRVEGGGFWSCRYDRWRTGTGATLERDLRRYWSLAAGLHRRFAYVLSYLYDAAHHNHIHIDNGRSGRGESRFQTRSGAQVQAVQAMLTHLWGRPTEITGSYDAATRTACGAVLDQLALPDDLTDQQAWQGFLDASAVRSAD